MISTQERVTIPRAEKNLSPRGQAYGSSVKQTELQTAGAEAAVPAFRPSAIPAGAPRTPREVVDVLTSATDRPDEPVTAGLQQFVAERNQGLEFWAPLLDELAASPDASPYVRELAARARIATNREA